MSIWNYMKNGAQSGPATTDEIRGLISSGTITADALVWREGLPTWKAANSLSEFAGLVPPASTPATAGNVAFVPDPVDLEKNKVFGILCYLPPLLFIVSLITARNSKFAMYHCNQALVLMIACFGAWIANMILGMVLAFIPILGWLLILVLNLGLLVASIGLVVMGLINAANGVCKPLPFIGHRFTLIK